MAEIMDSTPAQTAISSPSDAADVAPEADASRKISAPAPNPSFSFPMLPIAPQGKDGERLNARIPSPLALPMQHHSSLPSLGSGSRLEAPQVSPSRAGFMQRARGHQRGGSEFIGGDGSTVGPGLMSTSPTKGEGALPSPPASMGRRRGHAHRRSGAISNHDLSAILKPKEPVPDLPHRPGSLPSSPTTNHEHSLDRATSQPTLKTNQAAQALADVFTIPTPEGPPTPTAASPPTRPRVGFSDTLEFIPRPLSTISSETSSSVSTLRPSHSASGSISSIISIGTSSPPSAKKNQYTHDVLQRYRQISPRANTMDSIEPINTAEVSPTSVKRPSSPGAGAILKASQSPHPDELSDSPQLEAEASVSPSEQEGQFKELPSPWRDPPTFPSLYAGSGVADISLQERPRSSPETKSSRKQKKVKSWAESFLPTRNKGKMPLSPTNAGENATQYQEFAPLKEFSLEDVNFDEDTSCVINSPGYQPPGPSKSPTTASNPNFDDEEDDETPGAVLDLDAHWDELDENDKGGSYRSTHKRGHRRPLTSAGFHTDLQYHRRTESAPALTPISQTSGLARRANESPMADVFEEDEGEEQPDATGFAHDNIKGNDDETTESSQNGLAVTIIDQDASFEKASLPSLAEASISPQESIDTDERSAMSQHSEVQTPRDVPGLSEISVEIVDTVDEPRFSVVTKSSDESTVTPTLPGSPPQELQREIGLAVPFYNERHAASAPDAISFAGVDADETRVATMSSLHNNASILSSTKPHEIGVASSYSTEDVPSLTSSASTTASVRAANLANFPLSRPSADRSHSFSGVTPRRQRNVSAVKRASLASLSRLVGGSYAERSKLSLEVLPMDDSEQSEKKKRNRLSKLVRFWKNKEKTSSTA